MTSSKYKAQGTRYENFWVRVFQSAGLWARRIPEGGRRDEGDVEVYNATGTVRFVVESKAREVLDAHDAMEKAVTKAGTWKTALGWTRFRRPKGGQKRTTQHMICMPKELFVYLLGGDPDAEMQARVVHGVPRRLSPYEQLGLLPSVQGASAELEDAV